METLSALFLGARLHACVAPRELLDPAGGIDELLLTGEEGVAGGTDADFQIPFRRAGVIDRAAGTANGGLGVVGMNLCFHGWKKEVESIGRRQSCKPKDAVIL